MKLCLECQKSISNTLSKFSLEKYDIPLCMEHQYWIDDMENKTTFEIIRLYFALKERGIPAQMEQLSGNKNMDIVIPDARVNIEVKDKNHNYRKNQALSNLNRTYFSFIKGFFTIRIPNSLVYNKYTLEDTADFIVGVLNESLNKQYLANSNDIDLRS
ncbi:hypothetical protein [Flexithrix dorotheae]|uniref:hypothetical protein n=1 Tax=Flexithrix dorotheae TaxID=70993 RepID=UPI001FDEB0ED|nr:hypothetical protein [Flexithrix dorotheae]